MSDAGLDSNRPSPASPAANSRGIAHRSTSDDEKALNRHPPLVQRCRVFVVRSVPSTYHEFEALIEDVVSTCVYSRTNDAHRERGLVRGNASLRALWDRLTPGRAARVVPTYNWSTYRVESITFSSPDVGPPPQPVRPTPPQALRPPTPRTTPPPRTQNRSTARCDDLKEHARWLRVEHDAWNYQFLTGGSVGAMGKNDPGEAGGMKPSYLHTRLAMLDNKYPDRSEYIAFFMANFQAVPISTDILHHMQELQRHYLTLERMVKSGDCTPGGSLSIDALLCRLGSGTSSTAWWSWSGSCLRGVKGWSRSKPDEPEPEPSPG
jgi:hypothetical protein